LHHRWNHQELFFQLLDRGEEYDQLYDPDLGLTQHCIVVRVFHTNAAEGRGAVGRFRADVPHVGAWQSGRGMIAHERSYVTRQAVILALLHASRKETKLDIRLTQGCIELRCFMRLLEKGASAFGRHFFQVGR
jgi:hypothetical protein